jgi:hypothetical protein
MPPALYVFVCFARVSGFFLGLSHDPFSSTSWVAGTTVKCHHTGLGCWVRVLLTFFLGWPQAMILPSLPPE